MNGPSIRTNIPGPRSRDLTARSDMVCLGGAYRNVLPIAFADARGSFVQDVDGNVFIDFCFTLTATLGHGHPRIADVAAHAFSSLANASSYPTVHRTELAELLLSSCGGGFAGVQFFSCGAEAVEAGLWFLRRLSGNDEFLSFFGSNHGKTQNAISLGSMKKWHGLRSPGFVRVPYAHCYRCFYGLEFPSCDFHCVSALDRFLKEQTSGRVAAVVVEPIQGSSIAIPPPGYLHALRRFCDEHNLLLAADEVLTGLGRCGSPLTVSDGVADLVFIGKGLGNGLPITAVLVQERHLKDAGDVLGNTTFGGNPLCCRVAHECLSIMSEEELLTRAIRLETVIRDHVSPLLDLPFVGDVRGRGSLFGIEFVEHKQSRCPAPDLCKAAAKSCLERGVVTFASSNVLQITPALNIPVEVLKEGLGIVVNCIKNLAS